MYQLCKEYGVFILEDDPYYYLQYHRGPDGTPGGLQELGTSYLSLDTDGRVIRLDSFAKACFPSLLHTLKLSRLGLTGLARDVLVDVFLK